MKNRNTRWVLAISWLFSALWMYGSMSKALEFRTFIFRLYEAPVPGYLVMGLGYVLPIIEGALALLIAFRESRLLATWASLVMNICFLFYGIFVVLDDPSVPCACGGILATLTWNQRLLLTTILIGLLIVSIRLQGRVKPEVVIKIPV